MPRNFPKTCSRILRFHDQFHFNLRSFPTERLRLLSRNFPLMFCVARCERLQITEPNCLRHRNRSVGKCLVSFELNLAFSASVPEPQHIKRQNCLAAYQAAIWKILHCICFLLGLSAELLNFTGFVILQV